MSCEAVYGSFKCKTICKKMGAAALTFRKSAGGDACRAYDALEEDNDSRRN